MTAEEIRQAVRDLEERDEKKYGRPHWIPVLRAACRQARSAERYTGRFAGAWVLDELARETGEDWRPGLSTLVRSGFIEPDGPPTRGGGRRYYTMKQRPTIEEALAEIGQPV
jgi:hypothetical protein